MIGVLVGVALGWLAFTDEGRKAAGDLGRGAMKELGKGLKELGLLSDDGKDGEGDGPETDVPGRAQPGDTAL